MLRPFLTLALSYMIYMYHYDTGVSMRQCECFSAIIEEKQLNVEAQQLGAVIPGILSGVWVAVLGNCLTAVNSCPPLVNLVAQV